MFPANANEESAVQMMISNEDSKELLLAHKDAEADLVAAGAVLELLLYFGSSTGSTNREEQLESLTRTSRFSILQAAASCSRLLAVLSATIHEAVKGTIHGTTFLSEILVLDKALDVASDESHGDVEAPQSDAPLQGQVERVEPSASESGTTVPVMQRTVTFVNASSEVLQILLNVAQGKSLVSQSERRMSILANDPNSAGNISQEAMSEMLRWTEKLRSCNLTVRQIRDFIRNFVTRQAGLLIKLEEEYKCAKKAHTELQNIRLSGIPNLADVSRVLRIIDWQLCLIFEASESSPPVPPDLEAVAKRFVVIARLLWNSVKNATKSTAEARETLRAHQDDQT